MRGRADLHGRFRVDQVLQAGLQHPAEHVRVGEVGVGEDFADQGRQGRLVLGHRGIHFFASWRKQLGIPRWPVIVYDDEDPAGSDTEMMDSAPAPSTKLDTAQCQISAPRRAGVRR